MLGERLHLLLLEGADHESREEPGEDDRRVPVRLAPRQLELSPQAGTAPFRRARRSRPRTPRACASTACGRSARSSGRAGRAAPRRRARSALSSSARSSKVASSSCDQLATRVKLRPLRCCGTPATAEMLRPRSSRVAAMPTFADALNGQIGYEFAASQQYIAIAVYYDAENLPQLAAHFYRQAVEERNHAMMMVQYLLDADHDVVTPGVDAPQTAFSDVVAPVSLALDAGEAGHPADRRARQARARGGRARRRAVPALVPPGAA